MCIGISSLTLPCGTQFYLPFSTIKWRRKELGKVSGWVVCWSDVLTSFLKHSRQGIDIKVCNSFTCWGIDVCCTLSVKSVRVMGKKKILLQVRKTTWGELLLDTINWLEIIFFTYNFMKWTNGQSQECHTPVYCETMDKTGSLFIKT